MLSWIKNHGMIPMNIKVKKSMEKGCAPPMSRWSVLSCLIPQEKRTSKQNCKRRLNNSPKRTDYGAFVSFNKFVFGKEQNLLSEATMFFKIVNNYYTILSLLWCTGARLQVNKIEKCIMHSLTVYIILLFPNLSIKTRQLKSICKIERIPVNSVYFECSQSKYDNLSWKPFKIRNNTFQIT